MQQLAIAKWGNSLALRLPRHIVQGAGLTEGAPVEVSVQDGALLVTPVRKKYKLAELLALMQEEHRHGEVDWGEPRGQEVW